MPMPKTITKTDHEGTRQPLIGYDLLLLLQNMSDDELMQPLRVTREGNHSSSDVIQVTAPRETGVRRMFLYTKPNESDRVQPVQLTDRGFEIWERFKFRPYEEKNEEEFTVQTSSLATERKVWIGVSELYRAHLNVEEAIRVRDALTGFIQASQELE